MGGDITYPFIRFVRLGFFGFLFLQSIQALHFQEKILQTFFVVLFLLLVCRNVCNLDICALPFSRVRFLQ